MKSVRVVFMGTPDFAVPCLKYLVTNDYEIEAVYTQQDKSSGRGRVIMSSPVKRAAEELGFPVIQPRSLKSSGTVAELGAFRPDVIVVAAYGQILPQTVLDLPEYGCVNVHPSLLPRYRGVSPIPAAILAGDDFAGASIMLLDAGTDTGPVLSQAQIAISPDDTTGSLTNKLSRIGAQLLLETLPLWVGRKIGPRPQDDSRASYSAKLAKEDGEIDWHFAAIDIWRRVRAFDPWPGAFTTLQGKQLRVLKAKPMSTTSGLAPGQVSASPDKEIGFVVGTGRGELGILTVQLEGKKAMSAGDFVRGQRAFVGATLGR